MLSVRVSFSWAAATWRAAIARPYFEALRDAVHETVCIVTFSQREIIQLCKSDDKFQIIGQQLGLVDTW